MSLRFGDSVRIRDASSLTFLLPPGNESDVSGYIFNIQRRGGGSLLHLHGEPMAGVEDCEGGQSLALIVVPLEKPNNSRASSTSLEVA